jgi:hypothetical protein
MENSSFPNEKAARMSRTATNKLEFVSGYDGKITDKTI